MRGYEQDRIASVLASELEKDLEGDYSVSVPEIVARICEAFEQRVGLDPERFRARALAPLEGKEEP